MSTSSSFLSTLRRGALCLLIGAPAAQASAVSGLRDYFDTLASNRPVQQASNLWTFHDGNHLGALLAPNGDHYYNAGQLYRQIGFPVNIGDVPCSSGFCNVPPATTQATFAGVFVHSGSSSATAAVFHAQQAMQLDEVELRSEMVGNGQHGNGFAVTVNAVIGGVAQLIGNFNFDYNSTINTSIVSLYMPGLQLGAGDRVEILYGNRGSYLYDHGNVNAWIRSSAPGQPPAGVPEPASWGLAAMALLGLAATRRGARRL